MSVKVNAKFSTDTLQIPHNIYTVSKKTCHQILSISSQNIDHFKNSFTGTLLKICNNTIIKYLNMLLL